MIPNNERIAILKSLPAFAACTPQEFVALADLLQEEDFASGQAIVVENENIDRVHIILEGRAEVITSKKTPVATLTKNETIGLNDTGFYSQSGKRTATVIALSDVKTLSIDLKTLHAFFADRPHLQKKMYAETSHMLRMRLIKRSLPFVKLSDKRTQWLAKHVEELTLKNGDVVFQQGEIGDKCYLIQSGQVEIVTTDSENHEHRLAVLKPSTLFGEATLISGVPRNASARALGDVELLVLRHQHLSELIETEKNVAKMFMTLMVDRSRPQQNPLIQVHPRETADGQKIVILKNPSNGNYFKLSEEGLFIWQQLDGHKTMQVITMALANQYNTFSPDTVAGLISKLAKNGFVINVSVEDENAEKNKTFLSRNLHKLKRLLEFQYAFGDADVWLTKMYNKGVHAFFTPFGKLFMSLFACVGFAGFFYSTSDVISTFQIMPNVWWLFPLLIPFTLVTVALHELGHAFATKSFGHEVHYMGVGWYWTRPIAFIDTSDMWLSTRRRRMVVNLAGIYVDCIVAGICGYLTLFISDPYTQAFLWLFAMYTYITSFWQLSPLQEMDGYYLLMDIVDKPNLRRSAVRWLMRDFPRALKNPSLFKNHKPEIFYWLACLVYLVLVSIITLILQLVILKMLGLQSGHPYLLLALPLFFLLISTASFVYTIRKDEE